MSLKSQSSNRQRTLIVVAAPRECRSVLDGLGATDVALPNPWARVCIDRFDVVMSGVGKSNASGATARVIDPDVHNIVLSVGIAGALPGSDLGLCGVVVADRSVFADEGIGADSGFIPMSDAGFGAFPDGSMHATHDPTQIGLSDATIGPIATVSWCSGSDACALGVVDRTGALCEAMEGASVALVAKRVDPSIRTGEIRVISNSTGDRASQRWALDESLDRLREVLGRVASMRD
jgi:futalosine hydrolase